MTQVWAASGAKTEREQGAKEIRACRETGGAAPPGTTERETRFFRAGSAHIQTNNKVFSSPAFPRSNHLQTIHPAVRANGKQEKHQLVQRKVFSHTSPLRRRRRRNCLPTRAESHLSRKSCCCRCWWRPDAQKAPCVRKACSAAARREEAGRYRRTSRRYTL